MLKFLLPAPTQRRLLGFQLRFGGASPIYYPFNPRRRGESKRPINPRCVDISVIDNSQYLRLHCSG